MILQVSFTCISLSTLRAGERLFFEHEQSSCVRQGFFLFESVSTFRAGERLYSTVNPHVSRKVFLAIEYLSTLRAAERPFDFCYLNAVFSFGATP